MTDRVAAAGARGRRFAAVLAVVVLAVAGLAVLLAGPARAQPARPAQPGPAEVLGGYTVRATAAPAAVWLYEPVVPTTTEPQLEFDLAYARARMDTGPTTAALASTLWPGDTVGEGFEQLTGREGQDYPFRARARHPGGPSEDSQEGAPGSTMRADAAERHAEASTRAATTPSDMAMLLSVGTATSSTVVERADDPASVTARARAHAEDVEILGGLVRAETVRTESVATSDGEHATAGGDVTATGLRVAGQAVDVGPDGIEVPDGREVALPDRPVADGLDGALRDAGISVRAVPVREDVEGAGGSRRTRALVVSMDTGPLREALDAPTSPLLAAIPDDIRAQLAPILRLAPRIDVIAGHTTAAASAAPAADVTLPGGGRIGGDTRPPDVPADGGTGAAGSGSPDVAAVPGGGGGSGRQVELPMVAGEGQRSPYAFGGIPAALVTGVAVGAAALGWALRYAAGWLLGGAAACELGAGRRVPNLREEGR